MTGYMFYRFMFESMGVSTVGPDLSRAVHVPSIASIGALADVISSVSSKPSDSRSSHNLPGCRKAPVSSRRVPLGGFSQMTEMTGTLLWHSQTAAKRSLNNSRHLTTATWKKNRRGGRRTLWHDTPRDGAGGRAWQRHVRRKIVPCCLATSLATGECQRCHSRKCLRMNQRACRRQTKGPWEPCAFCFLPAARRTSLSNARSIYSSWSLSPTTHFTRSHGLWKFHFDARAKININKKKAG